MISPSVHEIAIRRLLGELGALHPSPVELLDVPLAAAQARRFKVDASFVLGTSQARFSVNDKGEPRPFRDRLRTHAQALGLPGDLERFLEISPPGEVQTTLGVKYRDGRVDRVSVYFEELFRAPRGATIHADAFAFAGLSVPPVDASLVSVCLDWRGGTLVGVKDYVLLHQSAGEPPPLLPPPFARFRDGFRPHPRHGSRRVLWARRFRPDGLLSGHKALWMSEAQDPDTARLAWALADRARDRWFPGASHPVLDRLRAEWSAPPTLYPDLVSLDADAQGRPQRMVLYVSVK